MFFFSWQNIFRSLRNLSNHLAPLLDSADYTTQDTLIGIFSELPTLDDAEIQHHLLPVALRWSNSADTERRRRITHALARMNCTAAQEALHRLLFDLDPLVRESAKSALGYTRKAQ